MWLPQGGALKIENLTVYTVQYYNATLFNRGSPTVQPVLTRRLRSQREVEVMSQRRRTQWV